MTIIRYAKLYWNEELYYKLSFIHLYIKLLEETQFIQF